MIIRDKVLFIAAVGLSLSIGWGIRGNFGHEVGAMIPGALAAMAAVVLSGREDWLKRVGSFAFFGALGWSFGGSISYMQVIAYTHSGHSLSVFYGFFCLFLIGFLWAIFGGVGTALPACISRKELNAFYPLVLMIFLAWCAQDYLVDRLIHVDPDFRQRDPLYWYDTDWLGISVALATTLAYALVRRRFGLAERLTIHLCLGWWSGFAFFVLFLGWRMTPPRGDNWAGCLGMAVGLSVFLVRARLYSLVYAGLIAGLWGGIGFACADFFKLIGITTGWVTNWHSVLEQSYGLINGIGMAVMMLYLRRSAPGKPEERAEPGSGGFYERLSICFVLIVITYLNLHKNVETWIKAGTVPQNLYGISASFWFGAAYLLCGLVLVSVLFSRCTIGLLATSNLSKAQCFYLVFLWWIVLGNFERALVGFAPQRLITEGVIQLNALICTALVLAAPVAIAELPNDSAANSLRKVGLRAGAAVVISVLVPWCGVRLLTGDQQIGYASRHIRFGPMATAIREKPNPEKPHP